MRPHPFWPRPKLPLPRFAQARAISKRLSNTQVTLAIQFRKIAHLSGPHWLSCGQVKAVDIGIELATPPQIRAVLATNQPLLSLLIPPNPFFHKGNYGHVGVQFGGDGTQGASLLSTYAALRSGAGLTSLIMQIGTEPKIFIPPEVMRIEIDSPIPLEALARFTSIVLGPGIKGDGLELAKDIMSWSVKHHVSLVVDAGALGLLRNVLSGSKTKSRVIATPHPGEASRLLDLTTSEIESDRISAAQKLVALSENWPGEVIWVLKGACPIVASARNGLVVFEGGISTLSVGGSGDVLSGACAALLPQTRNAFDAALLSVSAHLQAGRNLLKERTRGFLAHEIADEISKVLFTA